MDSEYTPQSGEIKGILKKVHDKMSKDLTTATNEETTAIKDYEELIADKKKEIDAPYTMARELNHTQWQGRITYVHAREIFFCFGNIQDCNALCH